MKGEMRVSAPSLFLSGPLPSPLMHPHPQLQYCQPLSQDPGKVSNQGDLLVSCPSFPQQPCSSGLGGSEKM